MFIFYDWFANEYTTEREIIAPPERYLLTYRGVNNTNYIESYIEEDTKECLDFAYSTTERDLKIVEEKRKYFLKENGFFISQMRHWTIPADLFDKYVERFDLKPFKDIDDYKTRTHIRERTAEND
jgi:hypothetical protein